MDASYKVVPLPVSYIYGELAERILTELGALYAADIGRAPKHWAIWVFQNGCAVPVPTQLDGSRLPAIRACRLLRVTLQKLARLEVKSISEADRFTVNTALTQLAELGDLTVALGRPNDQVPG